MLAIETPFPQFFDLDGSPLDGGHLYFGLENQNPETNPIVAYWDSAGAQPAAQPIRTLNGYVVRNGTATNVFIEGNYSLTVRDKRGRLCPSAPSSAAYSQAANVQALLNAYIASLASSTGASQIGFIANGSASLTNLAAILNRTPIVTYWGAKVDGATDDTIAFNTAAAWLRGVGGGELLIPSGQLNCPGGLYVYDGVSLRGMGKLPTTLFKDTTTTQAVVVTAGPLVVYNNNPLPSNINAALVLDGPGGRYRGAIRNIRILGGLVTANQPETAKVEFGIAQLGTESDFILDNVQVENCQYAAVFPDVFAASITNCRFESCLRGPAIDSGTSLEYHSNYSNNCRDWGRYFRNISYTHSSNNACDSLNNPTMYPTRTRTCVANKLRSLTSFTSFSDGCEQPYGIVWELDTLDNCSITYPTVYGFGSDYSGVDEMAVVSIKGAWRDCEFKNLRGVGLKATGLLSGGAVALAAHHHDIYVDPATIVIASAVTGVLLTTTLGSRVPAGFGNNLPTNWPNVYSSNKLNYGYLAGSYAPTFQGQNANDVTVVRGADDRHDVFENGVYSDVDSVFDITPTFATANGYLILSGFPTNGAKTVILTLSPDQSFTVGVATQPARCIIAPGQAAGVCVAADGSNFTMAKIASGTRYRLGCKGRIKTV